jgi:hypothetical protein
LLQALVNALQRWDLLEAIYLLLDLITTGSAHLSVLSMVPWLMVLH